VFIRSGNLWMRDSASGRETALTTDGVKDFGYATDNAGWTRSDRPIVVWSPDSQKIATFQQDQRNVGDMYLVNTQVGHPQLQAWKYPLPGDDTVAIIHRVIIDTETATVVRLQMAPDPHRSTLCDHLVCRGGGWEDVQWAPDSTTIAFVSTSRDHRKAELRVADAGSGAVRHVFEEEVPTFFESGNGRVSWKYLPASNEVIWFSERDGWGQLYLYDLQSGKLAHAITIGEGNVTQLLRVDEQARVLFFQAVGREKGRDPYFTHLYRVSIDGGIPVLLTPEDANHEITFADSGRYFVDSYSKPDVPPVAVLRGADGKLVIELEHADIAQLLATGWKPPLPITVKARDGKTDLYGLLYRPTSFVAGRTYPLINHIYPGPQTGSVGAASNYMTRRRWDYFVKNLLGVDPPKEYELKGPPPAAPGSQAQ
ncbi:MAG: DPP IV N-terminal domain-containing protein, partial [Acidobacteriota bacterium]